MENKTQISEKILQIESEMKKLGMWQDEPLPESAFTCKEAFCADSMTFPQWLQFVLIPQVQAVLAGEGVFPEKSELGIYAGQQFLAYRKNSAGELVTAGDGNNSEAKLVQLLHEFDSFFKK
ncbi:MAG TPA: YqcC family protein [Candidatus Nanoarchaeia archaeon]|nr:YqcC family protein [Candidatus Nanoarchaeia archaeon]